MNIKSLLLGSAAALAAVSGAQAADAIVAAAPEPMEYVRVCDAFGTGYFYIPGTETCLKIGGEVRATLQFGDAYDDTDYAAGATSSADQDSETWDYELRARVDFDTKADSEIGVIGAFIGIEANMDGARPWAYNSTLGAPDQRGFDNDVYVRSAYITVGGFKTGYTTSFWDDIGISGENDYFTDTTTFFLASYTYSSDAFSVGVGIDDLSQSYTGDEVGIEGMVSAAFGPASLGVYGVYDFGAEEGSIAAQLSAGVGPGTFELYGAYASGASVYASDAEWTLGAAYGFKATEKFTITPSVNYWSDVGFASGVDAWGAGLLASYELTSGLTLSSTVDYYDEDGSDGDWSGFFRLTRSF
ncbi:porin [Agrobacterium sp. ES01]|uniref:porin n=1 Tax=Agrobacterium sp. ES01 TaxID=3420714 RepID=UPI003D0C760D